MLQRLQSWGKIKQAIDVAGVGVVLVGMIVLMIWIGGLAGTNYRRRQFLAVHAPSSLSSTDQGGGKRRAIIVMETHAFAKDS